MAVNWRRHVRPAQRNPLPADLPLVSVHVPWGGGEGLERCVDSLLNQTYPNIRVLVAGDGHEPPKFDDPRVVTTGWRTNRGAYYARAVMVAAETAQWTAIVDSDDWVEPEWLERLWLARDPRSSAVLPSTWWEHKIDGSVITARRPAVFRPPRSSFVHITSHTGLWYTGALRKIGYHPGFRVGWDTLLVLAARLALRVNYTTDPLYHRCQNPRSLSRAEETGLESEHRTQVRELLGGAYREMWYLRRRGKDSLQALPAWPATLRREVEDAAARLKERL